MEKQLDVSVVINTHNRAESLKVTLESLFHQMYKNFEVIVVNGPSTDQTEKVVSEYGKHIKLLSCPVRNLSVSRNIGIEAASGEIVAFIDDDGIADPYWIADLVAGYTGPEIGGVGGLVYDYTGTEIRILASDRRSRVTVCRRRKNFCICREQTAVFEKHAWRKSAVLMRNLNTIWMRWTYV